MTRTVVEQITQAGVQKLRFSGTAPGRYLTRAALAGAFIFVGALLSSLCAAWFYDANLPLAKLLGALAFSAALTLIVLLGGELFTGCILVMSVSLYDGRVRLAGTLRVWALAYLGNLLGILVLCLLLAGSGSSGELLGAYLALIVPGKLSAPWYLLLLRGVLCNFLVCIGVFAGFRLQSETAKALVITLAITTFVLTGLEHSIANMAYFALHALLNGGAVDHLGQPAGRRGFAGPPPLVRRRAGKDAIFLLTIRPIYSIITSVVKLRSFTTFTENRHTGGGGSDEKPGIPHGPAL